MKLAPICPATARDCVQQLCAHRCVLLRNTPIDELFADVTPALHFVGFRGEEYHSAVRIFGLPDFIHRVWDRRAALDTIEIDTIVFAKYHDCEPSQYSYDDSNQLNDPAAKERNR